jgi:metal-responsive CopG/Arc/MetJ family transcriptional regulator
MKTAISLPDPIFKAAEDLAKRLGMSRSQLYATAVSRFIESYRDDAITESLNNIYGVSPATIDPVLLQMQLHELPEEEWT